MRGAARSSLKDGGKNKRPGNGEVEFSSQIAVASLSQKRPNRFAFLLRRGDAAVMAKEIGAIEIEKFRFEGDVVATGNCGWRLFGKLGATVIQECVVTLGRAKTRLDLKVVRDFSTSKTEEHVRSHAPIPELDVEIIEGAINIREIAREVLLLELPTYPKIKGAAPSLTNLSDDSGLESNGDGRRPFASLSELRNRLCG